MSHDFPQGKRVQMSFPLKNYGETPRTPIGINTCIDAMAYGRKHTTRTFEPYLAYQCRQGDLKIAYSQSRLVVFRVGQQYRITPQMAADPHYQEQWADLEKHSSRFLIDLIAKTPNSLWGLHIEPLGDWDETRQTIVPFALPQSLPYRWARFAPAAESYEISVRGDRRFSPLYAQMSLGSNIASIYQLDIKGYRVYGNDWTLGKGQPPLIKMSRQQSYLRYRSLWRQWIKEQPDLFESLAQVSSHKILTDCFASSQITQARALCDLLNQRSAPAQHCLVAEGFVFDSLTLGEAEETQALLEIVNPGIDIKIQQMTIQPQPISPTFQQPRLPNLGIYPAQNYRIAYKHQSREFIEGVLSGFTADLNQNVGSMTPNADYYVGYLLGMRDRLMLSQGIPASEIQQWQVVATQDAPASYYPASGPARYSLLPVDSLAPSTATLANPLIISPEQRDHKGLLAALSFSTDRAYRNGVLTQMYPLLGHPDALSAYQAQKKQAIDVPLALSLMLNKFQSYPRLVAAIDTRGGADWIATARYDALMDGMDRHWGDTAINPWIKCLLKAYQQCRNQALTPAKGFER